MIFTSRTSLFFSIPLSLFMSLSALAGTVSKVKDNRVLISTDGDTYSVGDRFFAVDENNKKKGLVEITQVKGDKATGTLIKGSAEEGMTLTASTAKKSSKGKSKSAYGGLASFVMNTMTIKSPAYSLAGSSFDLLGFYQTVVDKKFSVRAAAGYQTFSATGNGGTVSLGYLGAFAIARYSFSQGAFEPWAGAGIGFLIPISKSSNVLDLSKVSTNQSVLISGGFDYALNKKAFFPFQVSYALLPNSSNVSASQIMITGGYGINF